jgi:hypothetical protein
MEMIFESIEILEDGTIKAVSAAVGETVHLKAEQFLQHLARMTGGEQVRHKRTDLTPAQKAAQHAHDHAHGHAHEHGGHFHTH